MTAGTKADNKKRKNTRRAMALRRNVPSMRIVMATWTTLQGGTSLQREVRSQPDECAIARTHDVVKTILLRQLRLGDTILAHAEQIKVGIDRIEIVILARFPDPTDAGQIDV